jgi:hypothetical protein
MSNSKKTILNISIPVVVLGGILLIGKVRQSAFIGKIQGNPVFAKGIIQRVEYKNKHGYVVTYSFPINDRFMIATVSGDKYQPVRTYIIGKSFPVIYSAKEPEYNSMLILPDDFKRYNVAFPDSLNWIKQYIE